MMSWNIAELLAEEANCRNSFYAVVAGYISAIYNRLKQSDYCSISVVNSIQTSFGLSQESDIAFTKELLSVDISQTLFQ